MTLEVQKRFSNRFSFNANYTLSKAIDDVVDFNSDFQANDQLNLRAERALSSFDQRHKVVAGAREHHRCGHDAVVAGVSGVLGAAPRGVVDLTLDNGTEAGEERHGQRWSSRVSSSSVGASAPPALSRAAAR